MIWGKLRLWILYVVSYLERPSSFRDYILKILWDLFWDGYGFIFFKKNFNFLILQEFIWYDMGDKDPTLFIF